MGVAEGRGDEEDAAGDAEICGDLAAGDHALQIGEGGGEEGGLAGDDDQRAVTELVLAGIEGHGDEFLGLEPVEGLLAGFVEGFAESFCVGGFVGGESVADDHGVGVAAAHGGVREVDGEAVAGLGDDGF